MQDNSKYNQMLSDALGVPFEDFKTVYNLDINASGTHVTVEYINKLHRSYGKPTVFPMSVLTTDAKISKAVVKKLRGTISRKKAQMKIFDVISDKGIEAVRTFISESFKLDKELIEESDIIWENYMRFSVGGVIFCYYGHIYDVSFEVINVTQISYKVAYDKALKVRKYFLDKE